MYRWSHIMLVGPSQVRSGPIRWSHIEPGRVESSVRCSQVRWKRVDSLLSVCSQVESVGVEKLGRVERARQNRVESCVVESGRVESDQV